MIDDKDFKRLFDEIAKIGAEVTQLSSEIHGARKVEAKCDLSTDDVARLMKRKRYTVSEWCRRGRCNARKSSSRAGPNNLWIIPYSEYLRICREGLLPIRKP